MAKVEVYEVIEEEIYINTAKPSESEHESDNEHAAEQKELTEAKEDMTESNQDQDAGEKKVPDAETKLHEAPDQLSEEAKEEAGFKKLRRKRRCLRARAVISLGNITEFVMREEYEFHSIKLGAVKEDGEDAAEGDQPPVEFGTCFLFVKGPALYTASAKAERFLLNREFRLMKWPEQDGFNYSRSHIVGLRHFEETATAVSVVTCGREGLSSCLMTILDANTQLIDNSVRDWIAKNTERMEAETDTDDDGNTGGPKPRTSKDEVNRILMHYMETGGGGAGGGTLLRNTAGVKTPERGRQNNIIAFSCAVDGKVKMFNARSGEMLRLYERVGYKLGEGEDKLDVTKDKSKRDMKSNPGHIGAVNGCLLLPVFPLLEEKTNEEDDGDDNESKNEHKNAPSKIEDVEDEINAFTDPDRNDTQRLLTWGADSTIKFWGLSSAMVKLTLKGHCGGVTSCSLSPNHKYIASASEDTTVRLWSTLYPRLLYIFRGHSDTVARCTFSPNGLLIASVGGYSDRRVKLWSVEFAVAYARVEEAKGEKKKAEAHQAMMLDDKYKILDTCFDFGAEVSQHEFSLPDFNPDRDDPKWQDEAAKEKSKKLKKKRKRTLKDLVTTVAAVPGLIGDAASVAQTMAQIVQKKLHVTRSAKKEAYRRLQSLRARYTWLKAKANLRSFFDPAAVARRKAAEAAEALADNADAAEPSESSDDDMSIPTMSSRKTEKKITGWGKALQVVATKKPPKLLKRYKNVRSSRPISLYWQYERFVKVERQPMQCQGCFDEPPWWRCGRPKPDLDHLQSFNYMNGRWVPDSTSGGAAAAAAFETGGAADKAEPSSGDGTKKTPSSTEEVEMNMSAFAKSYLFHRRGKRSLCRDAVRRWQLYIREDFYEHMTQKKKVVEAVPEVIEKDAAATTVSAPQTDDTLTAGLAAAATGKDAPASENTQKDSTETVKEANGEDSKQTEKESKTDEETKTDKEPKSDDEGKKGEEETKADEADKDSSKETKKEESAKADTENTQAKDGDAAATAAPKTKEYGVGLLEEGNNLGEKNIPADLLDDDRTRVFAEASSQNPCLLINNLAQNVSLSDTWCTYVLQPLLSANNSTHTHTHTHLLSLDVLRVHPMRPPIHPYSYSSPSPAADRSGAFQ